MYPVGIVDADFVAAGMEGSGLWTPDYLVGIDCSMAAGFEQM